MAHRLRTLASLCSSGTVPSEIIRQHAQTACMTVTRSMATKTSSRSSGGSNFADSPFLQMPGTQVPYADTLELTGGPHASPAPVIPAFRVLSSTGQVRKGQEAHALPADLATSIYKCMVKLQVTDSIFFEAQRQGRFSFYMTSAGEEASVVGSAAALHKDDVVFSQYREQGAFLWRGFSVRQMADQCFGNRLDSGKGRQMPVHYSARGLNLFSVSSPLGTQLPHAAGAAYSLKLSGKQCVTAAYFGDGSASEGDAHAALNFAATLRCPALFVCRNNGYAISTPTTEQYAGAGVAERGPPLGVPAVRVDGGDACAVFRAVEAARAAALRDSTPVLIECMSYRVGHHSTSDDSSRYRDAGEMAAWRARDPVGRLRAYLDTLGAWDDGREQALRAALREECVEALAAAGKEAKHPATELFKDVYKEMPPHLREQEAELLAHLDQHPEALPSGVPRA